MKEKEEEGGGGRPRGSQPNFYFSTKSSGVLVLAGASTLGHRAVLSSLFSVDACWGIRKTPPESANKIRCSLLRAKTKLKIYALLTFFSVERGFTANYNEAKSLVAYSDST